MTPSGIVTLLSDFGWKDPFAGLVHGVILNRFAGAKIVDLSHGIAPQDVAEAAFFLEHTWRWFPAGTVHVAVVDPGVGSERAALCLEHAGHAFVAPDNGLLDALAREPDARVHQIDLRRLGLPAPSRTFHGRDVFAPVAAELAAGRLHVEQVGPRAQARALDAPPLLVAATHVVGRIVTIDHFGNLITDIPAEQVGRFERAAAELSGREVPLGEFYAEVPAGEAIALVSSFDTLEIAVRDGSAASAFAARRGQQVVLRSARPKSS